MVFSTFGIVTKLKMLTLFISLFQLLYFTEAIYLSAHPALPVFLEWNAVVYGRQSCQRRRCPEFRVSESPIISATFFLMPNC